MTNTTIGYVRVVNKSDKKSLREGEVLFSVDRSNPDLGNPYVLHDKRSREQRNVVCAQFERMGEHDMRHRGPIYRAVMELADRVMKGERIALGCWCRPERCHADWIADAVRAEVARRQETSP